LSAYSPADATSSQTAGINVSQGSEATYARIGGIVNNHFTTNLPRNLTVENFCKSAIWAELSCSSRTGVVYACFPTELITADELN